jgi:Fe2+ or Zn2+ uptake regulation protein
MRMTKQRRIILEELKKVKTHPKADEIFFMVRKRIPNISLATVYRNLKILKDRGKIMELTYGSESSRFDGNPSPHLHFFCNSCKKVFDIEQIDFKFDVAKLRKKGFKVFGHRTEFFGLYKNCRV